MKIEIWFDFVCPFCYLGHRHLMLALEKFNNSNDKNIDIIYRSFQLSNEPVLNKKQSIYEYLSSQKGISLDFAVSMHKDIESRGNLVDLKYNFDKVIPSNTKLAHQLYHYCSSIGKGNKAVDELFKAYFTDGLDLENIGDLASVVKKLDIKEDEVREVLEKDLFLEDVEIDIFEADKIGISGVPYFVFNDKYVVRGAQPVTVFLSVLNQIYLESNNEEAY